MLTFTHPHSTSNAVTVGPYRLIAALSTLVVVAIAAGSSVRATDFPTLQDNTACARLVVAGQEVIVASHGSIQPPPSVEVISFTATGSVATRLAAPDGAAAHDCLPIEDT